MRPSYALRCRVKHRFRAAVSKVATALTVLIMLHRPDVSAVVHRPMHMPITSIFAGSYMPRSFQFLGSVALAIAAVACSADSTGPSASSISLDKGGGGRGGGSSTSNVVVTESDIARQIEDTPPTRSWVFYTRATTPATGTFVFGPGTPPLGVG